MKGEEEKGWREEARESRGGEKERERGVGDEGGEMKNDRFYSCCLVLTK